MMKVKKVIVSVVMVMVLLTVMVVPAFAATNTFTPYLAVGSSNNYLNVVGNIGDSMQGRKLNLWYTTSPGTDQRFTRLYERYGGKDVTFFVMAQNNVEYAINRASYSGGGGNQSIMWSLRNSGERDSAFKRPQNDPARVFLLTFYDNVGMHYSSDSNNASVYFAQGTSGWLAGGTPWNQP